MGSKSKEKAFAIKLLNKLLKGIKEDNVLFSSINTDYGIRTLSPNVAGIETIEYDGTFSVTFIGRSSKNVL